MILTIRAFLGKLARYREKRFAADPDWIGRVLDTRQTVYTGVGTGEGRFPRVVDRLENHLHFLAQLPLVEMDKLRS
jgi:hypothetical protein